MVPRHLSNLNDAKFGQPEMELDVRTHDRNRSVDITAVFREICFFLINRDRY
jgi:hypothetical protein